MIICFDSKTVIIINMEMNIKLYGNKSTTNNEGRKRTGEGGDQ
jgi:hypothetical protein